MRRKAESTLLRGVGLAMVLAVLGAACTAIPLISNTPNPTPGQMVALTYGAGQTPTHADIAYTNCGSDCSHQLLDIYLPPSTPKGVVLMYHGGGFYFGDKGPLNEQGLMMSLLDQGWILVSATYRVATANDPISSSRLLGDVYNAATWVTSTAPQAYGVPAGLPVVTAGHSAGGTLAGMMAMQLPGSIDGWISISGILDWHVGPLSTHWANTLHQGAPYGPDVLDMFSASGPPGYLIQGVEDPLVEPENVTQAITAASALGGPALTIDLVDNQADGTSLGMYRNHVPYPGANAPALYQWLDALTQ